MDDAKQILIFSDAGGTGRSYHADRGAEPTASRPLSARIRLEGRQRDPRVRTHQPNQSGATAFVPSGDHQCESAETLHFHHRATARHAGGNHARATPDRRAEYVWPEDNLESHYARDALRQLYQVIVRGKVEGCTLSQFETATGLSLVDFMDGGLRDELPPITTFLNRMLALTIDMQDILFAAFEGLLATRIEGAMASGTYEMGLETLSAESFIVTDRQSIYTHPALGRDAVADD